MHVLHCIVCFKPLLTKPREKILSIIDVINEHKARHGQYYNLISKSESTTINIFNHTIISAY